MERRVGAPPRIGNAPPPPEPESLRVVRVDSATLRVYWGRGFGPPYSVGGLRPDVGHDYVRLGDAEAVRAEQRTRDMLLVNARIFGPLAGGRAR